jgi:hypothetical protein
VEGEIVLSQKSSTQKQTWPRVHVVLQYRLADQRARRRGNLRGANRRALALEDLWRVRTRQAFVVGTSPSKTLYFCIPVRSISTPQPETSTRVQWGSDSHLRVASAKVGPDFDGHTTRAFRGVSPRNLDGSRHARA